MRVVAEAHVGQLQLAEPLDVDGVEAVDHDVGDGGVGQQRLERPEAGHLVEQLLHHLLALDAVERQVAGGEQLVQDRAQLVAQLVARQPLDRLQIQLLDQLLVQLVFELVVSVGSGERSAARRCGRPRRARHGR